MAALAGVPKAVITQAKQKLKLLENHQSVTAPNAEQHAFSFNNGAVIEPSLVEEQLSAIDPDNLSPRQAHELLYKLKALL